MEVAGTSEAVEVAGDDLSHSTLSGYRCFAVVVDGEEGGDGSGWGA